MLEITVVSFPLWNFFLPEIFAMRSIRATAEAMCFNGRNVQLNDDSGGQRVDYIHLIISLPSHKTVLVRSAVAYNRTNNTSIFGATRRSTIIIKFEQTF
jgi:hypothetical protein